MPSGVSTPGKAGDETKRRVAEELGVPLERQRYWLWAKRQNQTFRPNRVLLPEEEAQTVSQLRESTSANKNTPAVTKNHFSVAI